MRDFSALYDLPNEPAVYAFYSGGKGQKYVAYVGIAGKLKRRITQHLIRRDSSVTTGTSAVCLLPDYIESLSWWQHSKFNETVNLKAAEIVAFVVFNPALRSRAGADKAGQELYSDAGFFKEMKTLFEGKPTGRITFPTLSNTIETISDLKHRITVLEKKLQELSSKQDEP